MTIWEAVVLGIIQGATEFLPVSSSGHLVLAQYFFGFREPNRLFDIVLHVGTLAAILVFYRQSIARILGDLVEAAKTRRFDNWGCRFFAAVFVASIPTAALGLLIEKLLPEDLSVLTIIVSCLLIVNGFVLVLNRRAPESDTPISKFPIGRAFVVGIAQGLAVLPGISRSGTTITTSLFFRLERTDAAMFSFLMSIPAILGALLLKLKDAGLDDSQDWPLFAIGALTAAATGYLCLRWLVALLKEARFHHFAWYCWAVGIAGLIATIVN